MIGLPTDPAAFAWGVSTSSYQFEDVGVARGDPAWFETDWDACLVARRKAPPRGDALGSWSNFDKDLEILRRIGVSHYRFGVEWARVEPRPGRYNHAAIQRYVEMAAKLRAAGIEPIVCLWHFTFPAWLYDARHPERSNWLHPGALVRWKAFLETILPPLCEQVRVFAPQNEPNGQLVTGYLAGLWPPALKFRFAAYRRAMEACVRHFHEAADAVRARRADAQILAIHALPWWEDGLLDFRHVLYRQLEDSNYLHLSQVADACDFLGINYYYSQVTSPVSFLVFGKHRGPNYSMMGWRIDPTGLERQIHEVGRRFKKPMLITENGIATPKDDKRIRYMRDHIGAVMRARREGADVRGYFAWSLADNYEWHYGYRATFGLCSFAKETQAREPRPSADFYRHVIQGGIPELSPYQG